MKFNGLIGCDLSQAYELMQEDDDLELMRDVESIHNDALMESIFRLDGQEATRLVSFFGKPLKSYAEMLIEKGLWAHANCCYHILNRTTLSIDGSEEEANQLAHLSASIDMLIGEAAQAGKEEEEERFLAVADGCVAL